MNIEEFRDYCLSLPGTTEKMPFTEAHRAEVRGILVFCVADRWYCLVDVDEFNNFTIKYPPEEALQLRKTHEEVRPGWHMNKRHWITVSLEGTLDDDFIRQLLRRAHATLVATLPKRERAKYVPPAE